MKKYFRAFAIALLFVTLSACSTGEDVPDYDEPDQVDQEETPENDD